LCRGFWGCFPHYIDYWEGIVIEEIKAAVQAAGTNQKIAMFHFQVLKNAHELEGVDPKAFCREIGVRESYATEFTKMISLARVINEQGMRLVSMPVLAPCRENHASANGKTRGDHETSRARSQVIVASHATPRVTPDDCRHAAARAVRWRPLKTAPNGPARTRTRTRRLLAAA